MREKSVFFIIFAFLVINNTLLSINQTKRELLSKRFAFIVGANYGGSDRVRLQYAVSDAYSFAKVLREMGGVDDESIVLLKEPSVKTFTSELESLHKEVIRAKSQYRRVEVIFYYSGHSDDKNILLGEEKLSYLDFKKMVHHLPADVRIAILDSCASGVFTRLKGGKKRLPFLMDVAYNMVGYAFMTSSSSHEASQESDHLEGSFFTHNLIAGLRGAADMTHDGIITLNEAYQYAYKETLSQTEKTLSGPQHPHYKIQMSGTGDVIMTDIRNSSAVLELDEEIHGKIFIYNSDNGLVAELNKPVGRIVELGIEDGKYRISNIKEGDLFETQVAILKGNLLDLDFGNFSKVKRHVTKSRGNVLPVPIDSTIGKKHKKFQFELYGGLLTLNPQDLNSRPVGHTLSQKYWGDDYFSYLLKNGHISSYNKYLKGEFKSIERAMPLGFRLKYYFKPSIAVSLGFKFMREHKVSNVRNQYSIIEKSGEEKNYLDEFLPLSISAKGFSPLIGIHYGKRISPSIGLEAFVLGGPLIAYNNFIIDLHGETTDDSNLENFNNYIVKGVMDWYVEEEGEGTGLAFEIGLRLDFKKGKNFGIFLETGYAYQKVNRLSGKGMENLNGEIREWQGTWGLKHNYRERYWGILNTNVASNYWQGEDASLWIKQFKLDLSGFQVRIGVSFRF